jgi:hypothetical protein
MELRQRLYLTKTFDSVYLFQFLRNSSSNCIDTWPLDAVSLCAESATDQGKVYSAADKVP